MKKVILIRYGELFLKGKNINYFIKTLVNNIKQSLEGISYEFKQLGGRFIIFDYNIEDEDEIIQRLKKVFGIHSISLADEIDATVENIVDKVKNIKIETSFKVNVKRADKQFPVPSMQLACDLGEILLKQNTGAKVDLHDPKMQIYLDIRENQKAYLYYNFIEGLGGLPVGCAGKGIVLLSGGIDSPVSAYKIAQRGLSLSAVHFFSYPYTSIEAKEKVIKLAQIIKPYTGLNKIYMVSFTDVQEKIYHNCKNEYMITLMRRIMMRVSERIAKKNYLNCIVTGENLSQVASQTVESMTSTQGALKEMIVLQPLVAYDKEEIIKIAKKIGTFDTSILPYEDCCTVFLPKYPIIKPKIENVLEEEAKLNIDELVNECLKNLEIIKI